MQMKILCFIVNPPITSLDRQVEVSPGCFDDTSWKLVISNCAVVPNRLNMSRLWVLIFSPFFLLCSNCGLADSNGSSPDALQGGRRHPAARLRGVSDNNAAHSLIGGLVLAVPGGHVRPTAGAGHPLQGLCPALRGAISAEDGSGGPQAGQNQRDGLQADHSQAAAYGPGPALLPGCWVDTGRRWQLVCHDPQAERQDSASHPAHWWVKRARCFLKELIMRDHSGVFPGLFWKTR